MGAAALAPVWPATGLAQGRPALALQAKAGEPCARAGARRRRFGRWRARTPVQARRHPRRRLRQRTAAPAVLNWRGIDGVPAAEPLTARAPLASGGKEALQLPLRHAGTFLCDLGLLGDGQARPSRARALVVRESEPVAVDRDEVLLIEDWRLRADGTAIAPGADPKDTAPVYTINGRPSLDISARTNERIRLRFINGCQRSVIAIKLKDLDVRVMAIDSQPAEPFQARNGALVLAPGGRVDAFVDVTAPAGTVIDPAARRQGSPPDRQARRRQ